MNRWKKMALWTTLPQTVWSKHLGGEIIRERLESSRSSGAYWVQAPEGWGLNEAPYRPLFSVFLKERPDRAPSGVWYRVVPELLRHDHVILKVGGVEFLAPRAIRQIVAGFEDPALLAIGNCALSREDLVDSIHRVSEVYIVDRKYAVDLNAERRKLRDKLLEALKDGLEEADMGLPWEPFQGHLEIGATRYAPDFPEPLEGLVYTDPGRSGYARIYNHLIGFHSL